MSRRIKILNTEIDGLYILQRDILRDKRGYLERLFCSQELQGVLPGKVIVQVNHTLTEACHTIRGMHYQYPPCAEIKFVSCIRGEVFDVAVDLRTNSPTFLQWHGEVLSADNHKSLMIPEGFAHGFQTLSDECELIYFHTSFYNAGSEGGLNPLDPRLAIPWPMRPSCLSERDAGQPFLDNNFTGIKI